jgi:hypothetical protein
MDNRNIRMENEEFSSKDKVNKENKENYKKKIDLGSGFEGWESEKISEKNEESIEKFQFSSIN